MNTQPVFVYRRDRGPVQTVNSQSISGRHIFADIYDALSTPAGPAQGAFAHAVGVAMTRPAHSAVRS